MDRTHASGNNDSVIFRDLYVRLNKLLPVLHLWCYIFSTKLWLHSKCHILHVNKKRRNVPACPNDIRNAVILSLTAMWSCCTVSDEENSSMFLDVNSRLVEKETSPVCKSWFVDTDFFQVECDALLSGMLGMFSAVQLPTIKCKISKLFYNNCYKIIYLH